MDEKGYLFTPATLLLFIPIIIIAVAYSGIINDLSMASGIVIGGDTTSTTARNIVNAMEQGIEDAGRNAAYNATRKVIDDHQFFDRNLPYSQSKEYIKNQTLNTMNDYLIISCQQMELQTGREIFLNGQSVTSSTTELIHPEDITITQENPYGFYVTIRGGIPIRVTQKDQTYEGVTPTIKVSVSIEGLEDPYIYFNTDRLRSNVIFIYPEYDEGAADPYNFDRMVYKNNNTIDYLWYCLNGTDNPSEIAERPYYFPDPHGLSYFDRLENRTNGTSTASNNAKMTTFIIGDPLYNSHETSSVSHVDHEYFTFSTYKPQVTTIKVGSGLFADPSGYTFYISKDYLNYLNLENSY